MKNKAYFGGGCFWCLEAVFERINGVSEVNSGYSGGEVNNPSYDQVSSGESGHAEVIEIIFDNEKISYEDLLNIFFGTHDPTTLNQQGADIGTQYRSIILTISENQKDIAKDFIKKLEDDNFYENDIVTEVKEFEEFYKAEDYHQKYYENNQTQGYCRAVIDPKLKKLENKFEELLK